MGCHVIDSVVKQQVQVLYFFDLVICLAHMHMHFVPGDDK